MIANSKNQDLVFHSVAVGLLAVKIFEKNYEPLWNSVLEQQIADSQHPIYKSENFKKVLFNAGIYHDVGKLDRNFQNYLENNKKISAEFDVQIEKYKNIDKNIDLEEYPLHHEISWAFLSLQDNFFENRDYLKDLYLYTVYWHHAKKRRKKNLSNIEEILVSKNFDLEFLSSEFNCFNKKIAQLLKKINSKQKSGISDCIDFDTLKEKSMNTTIPNFQNMIFNKLTEENVSLLRSSLSHLSRSILISADRCISKLSKQELEKLFDTSDIDNSTSFDCLGSNILDTKEYDLTVAVDLMKEQFLAKSNNTLESQERNKAQEITVNELAQKNQVCVLQGPAGVGKTKIMLEWLAKIDNKKKTYIIAPKTNIVNELYNEIKDNYLVNTDIEKITGAEKNRYQDGKNEEIVNEDYFKSTINITTIDQLMSLMMSHNNIDVYLDVLNSNIIFDEFHEFFDTPALLMLFIQTIILKKMSGNGKALLVSATPNPFLLEKLNLSIKKGRSDIVRIKTFNTTDYEITPIFFDDAKKTIEVSNKMFDVQNPGTICIFNTATKAQISSIKAIKAGEKNTLTYHSKYFPKDRKEIFSNILIEFGKSKDKKIPVLRTGPILQASIDISTQNMQTEISSIDNIYQRLGRLVRWNEVNKGYYNIAIPNNYSKEGSIFSILNKSEQCEIVEEFIDFLKNNVFNQNLIQLNSLYDLYFEFFELKNVQKAYENNWNFLKEESNDIFQKNFEPIKYYKTNAETQKILPKKTLRSNSIFGFAMTLDLQEETENEEFPILIKEIDEVFSLERKFAFEEEDEAAIINELKRQIEINYTKKNYLKEIRKLYLDKIYKAKNIKNIDNIDNIKIIDLARYEETPIFFSYENETELEDKQKRYNIIYKGLKLGLMNYETFKKSK